MKELRDCFVETVTNIRESDSRIHVLVSDSTSTCKIKPFQEKYPEAVINVGIAEQNLIGIAAGMALGGLVPFTANAAPFLMGRSNEQVKNDVCYSNTNVKLVGLNPGFAYGSLGPTHHCLDDISTARAFGNIRIFAPCDPEEVIQVTEYAADYEGPVYIRLDSYKADNIHKPGYKFKPGEPAVIREGSDVSLFTLGTIVHDALKAADKLSDMGINAEVVSIPSIRPLNPDAVIASIKKTGAAVSIEEHSTHGGIGTVIGEIILDNRLACKFKRLGVPRRQFCGSSSQARYKKAVQPGC